MIDHDRLSKELFTTFFVEALELFLPDLAARLDKRSLEFLDKEIFTDVTSGEKHEVDVAARVRFRGQNSCFLIHLENQAQKQKHFNRRMFSYFARLHGKYGVPVYPIAIFSYDQVKPEPDRYEILFPDFDVLRFRFRVIHLKRLRWRDFLRHHNPVASALMAKMGFRPQERVQVKLECLRLLAKLRLSSARQRLVSGFIDTYLQLDARERLQFKKKVASLASGSERLKVMELTTSWKEEGRKEGRQEGARQIVLRLLKHRWGTISPLVERKVGKLDIRESEALAEALLGFSSLKDVERWLAGRR